MSFGELGLFMQSQLSAHEERLASERFVASDGVGKKFRISKDGELSRFIDLYNEYSCWF